MPLTLAAPEILDLGGQWRVQQLERKIDLPAHVPGSIHTDLLAAHAIPDPFYRDNEKAVQWVGEVPWVYSRKFEVSKTLLSRRYVLLRAESLDTLATITINGRELAKTGNIFRTWEFNAKPFLHPGTNLISIRFDPVGPVLKAKERQDKFPGKEAGGQGYVRKTPVQNGWDFAPKLLTCGIPRPIQIVAIDEGRINFLQIRQTHRAHDVMLAVFVSTQSDQGFREETTVSYNGKVIDRQAGTAPVLVIPHPKLWWPSGMGAQPLYEVKTVLKDSAGGPIDEKVQRVGLRTIQWTPKTATHPLSVSVNGRRMFVKGANWIPPDALNARVTHAQYAKLIGLAKAANMNMLRFWGGGLYEDDDLYDLCDKAGILVWFEFKFACTPYPAFDPDWVADVRQEALDNVVRLRNHPSIAIWSGNNEVGGFVDKKTSLYRMSQEDYDLLFHHVLAKVIREEAPEAQYTPGSPESGDEHNWAVWHGGALFETYRDDHGFMSEFGFQSFPEPRTIQAVTAPEDRRSVTSPILKFRQRNIGGKGNEKIAETIESYFRKPKDFNSTLWLSQIDQALGILTGVEHWRRDWPHSTGSLVWQFDDDWPTASWSMIDYYGRPKALYYRLKNAYAPLALSSFVDQEGKAEVWVANDERRPVQAELRLVATHASGGVFWKSASRVAVPLGVSSLRVAQFDPATVPTASRNDLLLWSDLLVNGKVISRSLATFVRPKALRIANPGLRATVAKAPGGYQVTLTAVKPALWAWIEAGDAPLYDNFVDVRPGEPRTIFVHSSLRPKVVAHSLYDTFDPRVPVPDFTVRAASDGSIAADAAHAELIGGLILERNDPPNIGNWSREQDSLEWQVTRARAGRYHAVAAVASPEGGSRVLLQLGASRQEFIVPKTGSWTTYTNVDLGEITLPSGPLLIRLIPKTKQGSHVMNLRGIDLTPKR
jgi:beta-mannosidase